MASKIRKARLAMDMKQNRVAQDLGIASSRLCRIENGLEKESEELVNRFLSLYDIDMKSLPRKKKKKLLKRHTFVLQKDHTDTIKRLAYEKNIHISEFMERIIEFYLKRNP